MGGVFSRCRSQSDDIIVLNHYVIGHDFLESAQRNEETDLKKAIRDYLLALQEFEQTRTQEECEEEQVINSLLVTHRGLIKLYRLQKKDHEVKKYSAEITRLEQQLAEKKSVEEDLKPDQDWVAIRSAESKMEKVDSVFPEYVKLPLKEKLDPNKPIDNTVFLISLYHELEDRSLQKGLLHDLAKEIVECFGHRVVKDESIIQEVIPLIQVGDITITQSLLKEFLRELEQTRLLEIPIVKGLGHMLEQMNAELFHTLPNQVDGIEEKKQISSQADDNTLVQILEVLFSKFKAFHQAQGKESNQTSLLAMVRALSHVLDAMLGFQVSGLNRKSLYMPVHDALKEIAEGEDILLKMEATRALQVLVRIRSDESKTANIFRRMHHVVQAAVNIKSVLFDFDLSGLVDLYDNLQEAFTFCKGKEMWYEKLRYCECLIKLRQFRKLEAFLLQEETSLKIPEFELGVIHYLDQALHSNMLAPEEKRGCLILFKNMFYCYSKSYFKRRVKSMVLGFQKVYEVQDLLLGKMVEYVRDPALRDLVMLELFEIRDHVEQDWQKQLVLRHRLAHIEYMKEEALNEVTLPDQLLKEAKKIVGRKSIIWKLQSLKTAVLNDENISQELMAYIAPMGHQRDKEEERYDLLNQMVLKEFLGLKAFSSYPDEMMLKQRTISTRLIFDDERSFDQKEEKPEMSINDQEAKNITILNASPQETQDKVLLLLGGAGTGKSTFGKFLERYLWEHYQSDGYVPLFISLTMAQQVNRFLIETNLREKGFSRDQIEEIRLKHKLIVILDGYDEINQHINLYASNQLDRWPGIKVIVSCRPEHLEGQNYQQLFIPTSKRDHQSFGGLKESFVALFDDRQVESYLNKYVTLSRQQAGAAWTGWSDWKVYHDKIKSMQGLEELIHTPFMLKIIVDVLPGLLRRKAEDQAFGQGEHTSEHIHRVELYQAFTEQWYANEKLKLDSTKMALAAQTISPIYEFQVGGDIVQDYQNYAESLAGYMFEHRHQMFTYHAKWRQKKIHKELMPQELDCFFGFDSATSSVRKGCPLKCQGNSYMFIHKSLWEYYVAMRIYRETMTAKHLLAKGRLLLSRFWEIKDVAKSLVYKKDHLYRWILIQKLYKQIQKTKDLEQEFQLHTQVINLRLLSEEPMILRFLSELAKKDKFFKRILLGWLGLSQYDERYQIGAANAITILNLAKVPFSGMDLSGIRIPGADLSYALLHHTKLNSANLSNVNLYNACLEGADITKARFKDVFISDQYGAVLECDTQIQSADGQQIIFYQSDQKNNIYWYSVHHGELPIIMKHKCEDVTFSSDGKQVVLIDASEPGNPAYWYDIETLDRPIKIGAKVNRPTILFSPSGQHVFFYNSNSTGSAYWYDIRSKKELLKTEFYTETIEFSLDNQQVIFLGHERSVPQDEEKVIGSSDEEENVCNIICWYNIPHQMKCIKIKSGVKNVTFSVDSRQVVFYGDEENMAYWYDINKNEKPIHIEMQLDEVLFSSNHQHMICMNEDEGIVHVYDVLDKTLLVNLGNIENCISRMELSSPLDRYVAFFGDERVCWYDRQRGEEPTKIEDDVSRMVCSADGQQIIFFNDSHYHEDDDEEYEEEEYEYEEEEEEEEEKEREKKKKKEKKGIQAYWYDRSVSGNSLVVDGPFDDIEFSANSQYVVFYNTQMERAALLYDIKQKKKRFETGIGIDTVRFSPDNQQAIFFNSQGKSKVYWYDCDQVEKSLVLDVEINNVLFSANSQHVVFYNDSAENVAILYDVKSKTERFKVNEGINIVEFSPHDQWVVFYNGIKGQMAYCCNTNGQKPPVHIEDKITDIAFSPEGQYFVFYGRDTNASYLFKTDSHEISHINLMGVCHVAFTPDSQFILLAHEKNCYHWNVEEQNAQMIYEASSRIVSIQVQTEAILKNYLICTMEQGFYVCQDWSARSCQPKRLHSDFDGHSSRVVTLKALHDLVFSVSDSEEGGVWQVHPSMAPQLLKFIEKMDWSHEIIISPDQQQLIVYGGCDQTSYWYDRMRGVEPIQIKKCTHQPEFSPDSQQIVFYVRNDLDVKSVIWYSRNQAAEPIRIELKVTKVVFSSDSQQVIFLSHSDDDDEEESILSKGAYWYGVSCKTDCVKIDDFITDVKFSPDNKSVVFYDSEGKSKIYLYDVLHRKIRRKINNRKNKMTKVVFSPDSQQIVFCGDEEDLTEWYQINTHHEPILFEDNISNVIFSEDGRQVIFYSEGVEGVIYWYDLKEGLQPTKIEGEVNMVRFLARDQQVIFYSNLSDPAYWYHREHKNKYITIKDQIDQVVVSPDGQQVVFYSETEACAAYWYNQRYGTEEPTRIEASKFNQISFSPNSRQMILYGGTEENVIYWYDTHVKQESEKIAITVTNVVFSADSLYVIFYDEYDKKPAYCYDVQRKKNVAEIEGPITLVKFSPDGQHIVFCDDYNSSIAYWYDIMASQLNCLGRDAVKFEFVEPHYLFVYGLQSAVINLLTRQKFVLPIACGNAVFITDSSHVSVESKISDDMMPQYLLTAGYHDRTLRLWNLLSLHGPLLKWCSDGLTLSTNGLMGVESAIDLASKNKRFFKSEDTVGQKDMFERKEKQVSDGYEAKNSQEEKKINQSSATFFKKARRHKADTQVSKKNRPQRVVLLS